MKTSPIAPSTIERKESVLQMRRLGPVLKPDSSRVLFRPHMAGGHARMRRILKNVLALTEKHVRSRLDEVLREFGSRHVNTEALLQRNYSQVADLIQGDGDLSKERKLLIGAYCTSEYALESAALFNPSIVPHVDQTNLPEDGLRFILSLRATGEGHVSSIEFREGVIQPDLTIEITPVSGYVNEPVRIANPSYDKYVFTIKLREMGFDNPHSREILDRLGSHFGKKELESLLGQTDESTLAADHEALRTRDAMCWLVDSNYEIQFDPSQPFADRIIFPSSQSHRNGLEDARFVRFGHDEGPPCYYATYTAFEGSEFLPQLITTEDFLTFKINTLNGDAVQNKGMALFPEKIDGKYAMLSRQDDESIFIMYSENLHFWQEASLLMEPKYDWEFIKIGNCGSPIKTEHGWLVLTHGVGPMRRYSLGAALLDLSDPTKVLGRLPIPLLKPDENEREGYVPNVVYSCGALVHQGQLIVPYGMSDYATGFAAVAVDDVVDAMV